MIDVARLAGVSHQSVSRVVNGSGTVTPEVRRKVEQAIAQLRYRRHPAARALATNRTMTIGVVSYGLAQFGPSVALAGITEEALRAGYATNIVSLSDVSRASMSEALNHLAGDSVDGIIVLAPLDATVASVANQPVVAPYVVFYPGGPVSDSTVVTDEVRGAHLATSYLLDLGHRTVHHVAGPRGWMGTKARLAGWRDALSDRLLPAQAPILGDWSAESGFAAGRALAADGAVTAVFAANDQMALGVVAALRSHGRRVPDDVSVVGFDDVPDSSFFRPSLTTVRFDFVEVGRRAVDHILDLMAGRDPGPAAPIEPALVVRASAAAPPFVDPHITRQKKEEQP